jgi:hypothetical protein
MKKDNRWATWLGLTVAGTSGLLAATILEGSAFIDGLPLALTIGAAAGLLVGLVIKTFFSA